VHLWKLATGIQTNSIHFQIKKAIIYTYLNSSSGSFIDSIVMKSGYNKHP